MLHLEKSLTFANLNTLNEIITATRKRANTYKHHSPFKIVYANGFVIE